jgi:tRNA pseudouridine38-40 synthase
MARYKLILAYDGAAFAGSQRQASTLSKAGARKAVRTVQGELEKALRGLGWSGRSVLLAGRTDTGVHAVGQVAALDMEWAHENVALREALNARLPFELAVRDVEIVNSDFHPRFDAASRHYRYSLFCEEVRNPLREKTAWRVWPIIDGNLLGEIAGVFIGKKDFSAFGSAPGKNMNTVRTVMQSGWKKIEDIWNYDVTADAFLYRMVRRLVAVQVAVAQGRCSVGSVVKALEKPQLKSGLPAGLAPAHGLELIEVGY